MVLVWVCARGRAPLRGKIAAVPDAVILHSGHGPKAFWHYQAQPGLSKSEIRDFATNVAISAPGFAKAQPGYTSTSAIPAPAQRRSRALQSQERHRRAMRRGRPGAPGRGGAHTALPLPGYEYRIPRAERAARSQPSRVAPRRLTLRRTATARSRVRTGRASILRERAKHGVRDDRA